MSTWKKVWGSLEIPWGAQVGSLDSKRLDGACGSSEILQCLWP